MPSLAPLAYTVTNAAHCRGGDLVARALSCMEACDGSAFGRFEVWHGFGTAAGGLAGSATRALVLVVAGLLAASVVQVLDVARAPRSAARTDPRIGLSGRVTTATLSFQVTSQGGVPTSGVSAVALSITMIHPAVAYWLVAWYRSWRTGWYAV